MTFNSKRIATLALGAAALLSLCGPQAVQAQEDWPAAKTIRLVSSSPPGSGIDSLARAVAQRLSVSLNQQVIVDNRPGASGSIAISAVAKAPNDGYTLLYCSASNSVIWPAVAKSVPFDTARDLEPIAQTAAGGILLLVNSEVPAKNMAELIAFVKANPDKYSFATWGTGSSGHLMMEWLKQRTGMKINHVAYRATAQMMTELSSGVLKVAWADPSVPLPFLRTGKIRAIAISGSVRGPQLPDIPTMDEQGFKFETLGWYGMFAPAGTNPAILKRLSEEVNKVQASPEMAKLMNNLNFEPPPVITPSKFRAIVLRDLQTWKKIASDTNVSVEN